MAKASKRETTSVSQETIVKTSEPFIVGRVHEADLTGFILETKCSNCLSWRPEVGIPFGGCAKSGLTTTHYGETRYVHYTPDGASCSSFEAKE